MRLSSLSVFSALRAALMLLQSDCSVDIRQGVPANMSTLPEDMLALVLSHLSTDLDRRTTSKLFRGLSMFPLTEEFSTQYIMDEAFRNEVNATLANPHMQVILHLGGDIAQNYIADENFRATINALLDNPPKQITLSLTAEMTKNYIGHRGNLRANVNALLANHRKQIRLNLGEDFEKYMRYGHYVDLVENPLKQIWSDVEELELHNSQVDDIRPLAGLKNLKRLGLSYTKVTDITPLKTLKNLEFLDLFRTRVTDTSSLGHLPRLTISRC